MRVFRSMIDIHRFSMTFKFVRDQRGVTAVEFAFVAPIALLLLFGEYTLCDAMSVKRKVTIAAHSIGDLVARQASVTTSSLSAIMNASTQMISPYNMTGGAGTVIVAELTTDANGKTTVTWSGALNTKPLTAGQTVTLAPGLAQPNTALIYSIVSYSYKPILGQSIFGNQINFSSSFYENPRATPTVGYTN